VSLFQLLYEPGTKLLLSRFGGLAAVGYYEMASRLVNQVRALIVNANQVMIPVVAQASFRGAEEVRKLYKRTMSATLFVNTPLICAIITFGAFISLFWIGHVEPAFMFPLVVLSVTMFFNVMCGPAFYSSLGLGKLNLLVYVHLFMAFLNISLGLLLGHFFGARGVIISWGITFTSGSLLLIIFYQRDMLISFGRLFSQSDIALIVIAAAFAFGARMFSTGFQYSNARLVTTLLLFAIVFIPLLLSNQNLKSMLKR
jgi:O-antigen/teichoic acid export membrane protein